MTILDAESGEFLFTGTDAGLASGRKIAAGSDSYSFTGTAAGLKRGYTLTASAGSYTLTGTAVTFNITNRRLPAASGTFSIDGGTTRTCLSIPPPARFKFTLAKCCCGCTISSNTTTLTTCSGTWEDATSTDPISGASGKTWKTTGTGIMRTPTTQVGDYLQPWHVTVQTARVDSAAGSSGTPKLRVLGGLKDCFNYAFYEWTPVWQRLGEVVDGIETELIRNYNLDPIGVACRTTVTDGPHTFQSSFMGISWDGDRLHGFNSNTYDAISDYIASPSAYTPCGWGAGIEVNDLGSFDKARFADIVHDHYRSSTKWLACGTTPLHCCLGTVPANVLIEIGGTPSGTWAANPTFCPAGVPCTMFLGTYTVPHVDLAYTPTCHENSVCGWDPMHTPSPVVGTVTCFGPSGWAPFNVYLKLSVGVELIGGVRSIYVLGTASVESFASATGIFSFRASTTVPCDSWTDWITLSVDTSGTCNPGSMTCRIKKA